MDDLQSEKEQIEEMRAWWSDYGNYVIGGIVLGATILIGWNYMQRLQLADAEAASTLYQQLANHVVDGEIEDAEAAAARMANEFGDSAYAVQAKLAMARLYMDSNRDQDAADEMQELIDGAAAEGFKQVARIRLAKILLYQGKAQNAADLLEDHETGPFAARVAESLGDAYVALGRHVDARDAYQRALAEVGNAATVDQTFVQLKLLDLPVEAFAAISGDTEATAAGDEGTIGDLPGEDSSGDESASDADEPVAAEEAE